MLTSSRIRRNLRLQALAAVLIYAVLASSLPAALAGSPNAVTLRYFRAQARANSVFLEWETGTEIDHGGFQLYRSQIANDPGRGVFLSDDFPPQDEFSGGSYSYTDASVQVGTTYYYTLVAFDLRGSEAVYRSEPQAVTPGQAQPTSTPTVTPTRTATPTQVASATSPAANTPEPTATTRSTNTPPAVTPTTAPSGPGFATATPTTAPASQSTIAPSPTPVPAVAPSVSTATTIPTTESIAPIETPLLPVETLTVEQGQGNPANAARQGEPAPTAAQPASTESAGTQAAPAVVASAMPERPAASIDLPTRAPRPTVRPEATEPRSSTGALLAVIAALAIGAAALLLGIIVVLWLRSRNSQG